MNPKLHFIPLREEHISPLTTEEYAVAFNKKNVELCKAFNEVIAEMKKSGALQKSIDKNEALARQLKK